MDAVATAVQRWFGAGQVEPALERLFEVDGYLAERLLGEIQRVAEARHVPLLRAVLEPAAARAEEGDWPEASEPLPAAAALGPLIGTLARIGGEPARSGLRSLLGEAQPWIRDEALRALLGMDGTDADAVLRDALAEEQPVEVLQVALEHPRTATDDGLRARTVERLRSLPDGAEVDLSTWFSRLAPQARTSTAETLLVRDEPHAAPPAVVVQALGVLGDAPDPDIAELARWLRAEDARVRQAAVEQLGRTYDRAAVPHLIEALKDADAEVYDAAEDALQRFETFFEQRRRWQGLGKDG